MVLGRMWSWLPLLPGRIPRKARNTARGDPIQKKFSTWGEISSTLIRMEKMFPNTAGFDFSLHFLVSVEGLQVLVGPNVDK